jgi:hypothetical protein
VAIALAPTNFLPRLRRPLSGLVRIATTSGPSLGPPTSASTEPRSVELGDAGPAIEQTRAIDPSQLPSLERRVHHLLDLAQGFGQWRKDHEALDALLQAERLAPQEVHLQPAVQRLVVELLHRERRTTKPQLRELARRVGVLAA